MKCDACKLKPKCDDLERAGILPKIEDCRTFVPLPTNADRIRAMTDEKLAWFIINIHPEDCPFDADGDECLSTCCEQCWLDWLRKEADSDG